MATYAVKFSLGDIVQYKQVEAEIYAIWINKSSPNMVQLEWFANGYMNYLWVPEDECTLVKDVI